MAGDGAEHDREVAPFGTWPSPVTAELLVQGAAGAADLRVSHGWLWWLEARPQEGGRVQLVRVALAADAAPVGEPVDLLPDGFSARTRVHEYGGGALWVHRDTAFVCSWDDQRVHRIDSGSEPVPITPEPAGRHALRYADGDVSPDGQWIACVREEHDRPDATEAVNEIVAVPTDGSAPPIVVATGADFVARPRWSPDGTKLAWVAWDHPDMPWDATTLWLAEVAATTEGVLEVTRARPIAGGDEESIAEVAWDPEGRLWFASDQAGWWDLWRLADTSDPGASAERVVAADAELTLPHWVFGTSRLAFPGDGLAVVAQRGGIDHLLWADDRNNPMPAQLDTGWTSLHGLAAVGDHVAAIAATFWSDVEVLVLGRLPDGTVYHDVARPARELGLDPRWFSQPEHVTVPTGIDGAERAHALVYPPTSTTHSAPPDERPPLIVMIHGGPTSAARSQMQLSIQFWTSRGFAVADVNYRGSVGYGREFRHSLDGRWGIADVEDCVAVARWLAEQGRVDGDRLAIRGGSAGGFTTLCALTFHDTFAVGVSSYGVTDLAALAADTHKFESRYLDRLVGPWPEANDVYQARSPSHHTDRLATPLLILQGVEDEVVPPSQAEVLVQALRDKGIPHAYLLFEGEQHGWRQASTIVRALGAELTFLARVLGFEASDDALELDIVGL